VGCAVVQELAIRALAAVDLVTVAQASCVVCAEGAACLTTAGRVAASAAAGDALIAREDWPQRLMGYLAALLAC
jgi:hypothetical protein